MELKAGYEQTEVGVIPEDWALKELGDVAEIEVGLSKPRIVFGSGCPVVMVQNLYEGSRIRFSGLRRVTATDKEIRQYRLTIGDVLFANASVKRDGIGYANKFEGAPEDVIFAKYLYRASNLVNVDSTYLFYVLRAPFCRQWIISTSQTGTLTNLNKTAAAAIPIPLPPTKDEQEAIAEALSDADALVESLEQLIAKKRQIKQGAAQELLTPKDDWVEKRLADTATLKARIGWQGLTTAEYLSSGDYYLVTGTDFTDGHIGWENCAFVDESRYKQDKNIQLQQHDVLVTKDGTIGKVAFIDDIDMPATLNSGVFVLRPTEESFDPKFFYFLLLSDVFTSFLEQLSAGSTINHLYQKDFVTFVYKTPTTMDEQIAIAEILSDMDTEIAALETRLGKARQVKQGMMQELLTGRIRLV